MDFFKSVFSDDSDFSNSQDTAASPSGSPPDHQEGHARPSIRAITDAWSFGGLINTLASKSESVIETYRRDLEEFGSGLRKETAVIREVAGRAVRDLPRSLEAGAVAAQESLESVGEAVDNIGSTVSEIISQGKDSILAGDSDGESNDYHRMNESERDLKFNLRPQSSVDARIRTIQRDLKTYCKEPEDLQEYNEWKLGFNLDEKNGEIEGLIEQNGLIEEIYDQVVPDMVDRETFWSRYFYKVYRVRKAEEARAKLVKRAISGEEEEELSWDVDDDDYEENEESKLTGDSKAEVEDQKNVESSIVGSEKSLEQDNEEKADASVSKSHSGVDERVHLDGSKSSSSKLEAKSDDKLGSEGKIENVGSSKDGNLSAVASQPCIHEEEDLGWDEIEDVDNTNGIKVAASGSPNRADLRKRLSAMEEEEDLSWGSEDDEKPVKS